MEELLQGFWGGVIGDMIAVIFVLCHFLGKKNHRLKLTLFQSNQPYLLRLFDFSDIHSTDLCLFNFSTVIVSWFILSFEWFYAYIGLKQVTNVFKSNQM